MTSTKFPSDIKTWLNERGISDEVLLRNDIRVQSRQIVIPVYDASGTFLFNKYRRDPFGDESGPKYRYDTGATRALYNINSRNLFSKDEPVYLCEGELDAMALQSAGYCAMSTTGGAGTFDPEWKDLLADRKVFVCYDNDGAGLQGAIRILKVLPCAFIVLLPQHPSLKDVTDFLKAKPEMWETYVAAAMQWRLPLETTSTTKTEIKKCVDSCSELAASLTLERQQWLSENRDVEFIDLLLAYVRERYDFYHQKYKYKRPQIRDGDAIAKARAVPITEYIQFNKQGNAKCINHDDKNPSMHYFKRNNKVKCFPCGFNGDTIDVVMKLFNLTTGEAIKKINGV